MQLAAKQLTAQYPFALQKNGTKLKNAQIKFICTLLFVVLFLRFFSAWQIGLKIQFHHGLISHKKRYKCITPSNTSTNIKMIIILWYINIISLIIICTLIIIFILRPFFYYLYLEQMIVELVDLTISLPNGPYCYHVFL